MVIDKFIKIIVTIIISGAFSANAQVKKLNIGDTLFLVKVFGKESVNSLLFSNDGNLIDSDFKDSLPDGIYEVIDTYGKKKYTKARGQFVNNQRHGKFEYFSYSKLGTGFSYMFFKGKLHGKYESRIQGRLSNEGYYIYGKKNGIFLDYHLPSLKLAKASFYLNDSLKNWEMYSDLDGNKILEGFGELYYSYSEYTEFDTIGFRIRTGFFSCKKMFKFIDYFPYSNKVCRIASGDFQACHMGLGYFCNYNPINGFVNYYSSDGSLLCTQTYVNGILIKNTCE